MALLNLNVSIEDIPETNLLPVGVYTAKVKTVESKQTSKMNGHMLKIELSITGPTNEGSSLFTNIIYEHESEVALRLGMIKIGQLCRACGMSGNQIDTDMMLNKEIGLVEHWLSGLNKRMLSI